MSQQPGSTGEARPGLAGAVLTPEAMSVPGARILDPHRREMAAMLAEISAEIEQLGEVLCADPEFVSRHLRELQAFDLISQKQRALADMLRAECPISALDDVGLDEVVGRFRALGGKPV